MQEATLQILETVGVKFPSEKALAILADHGAQVDQDSQIVKLPEGAGLQGHVHRAPLL